MLADFSAKLQEEENLYATLTKMLGPDFFKQVRQKTKLDSAVNKQDVLRILVTAFTWHDTFDQRRPKGHLLVPLAKPFQP